MISNITLVIPLRPRFSLGPQGRPSRQAYSSVFSSATAQRLPLLC